MPLFLSVAYVCIFVRSEVGPSDGNGKTKGMFAIDQLQNIMSDDFTMLLAWVHYLAFDLFVGHIITANARALGMPNYFLWPCLGLTFYLGPCGYTLFVITRFVYTRAQHKTGESMLKYISAIDQTIDNPLPLEVGNTGAHVGSSCIAENEVSEIQALKDIVDDLTKKEQRLVKANKSLGSYHQRLNSMRPELKVPLLNQANVVGVQQVDKSTVDNYQMIVSLLDAFCNKKKKKEDHGYLDIPSDFPYENAASTDEKKKVNESIGVALKKLCSGGLDLSERLRSNPNEVLVVLDAPSLATSKAVLSMFPTMAQVAHQIIVPQADVLQYFQMISGGNGDHEMYLGLRAQRLDHWLCANAKVGFKTILFYADFETTFVGNHTKQFSPAMDIQRYFRHAYPAEPVSLLVLTVKVRPPRGHEISVVNDFVQYEGLLNGYDVTVVETWAKSMTTVMYEVRKI